MIDSFWTKWRVRRLCSCDTALIGRWLDDYVGWLYGRLWVRSAKNTAQAQQALNDIIIYAAGNLNALLKNPCSMSEWLNRQIPPKSLSSELISYSQDVVNQAKSLWTQSISDGAELLPAFLEVGQQALLMLNRDEQEVMICRYLRLEAVSDIASGYTQSPAQIEDLLYRARHSFRRMMESQMAAAAAMPQSVSLASQEVLDANLETLFRSLGPRPMPDEAFIARLKDTVTKTLAQIQSQSGGWMLRYGKWIGTAAVIGVLAGLGGVLYVCRLSEESVPAKQLPKQPVKTNEPSAEQVPFQNIDIEDQLKQVFAAGEQKDLESLVDIVRKGAYPAQLAAAHYLAKIGDKSAIDPLDRAAQKWYPSTPSETNPFIEAIAAIEVRIQEQARRQELEQRKQIVLETALPLIKERLRKREPNAAASEPNEPNVPQEPNQLHAVPKIESADANGAEPNILHTEPNRAEEPNDVNVLEPVNGAF